MTSLTDEQFIAPHELPESHEGRECPELPVSPQSPEYPTFPKSPVYPVSEGQDIEAQLSELVLERLVGRCVCTARNMVRKQSWQLAREVRALEDLSGRKLTNRELICLNKTWYRDSQPFLDPEKTENDYLAAFLAKLDKVRVPAGQGDRLKKAVEHVLGLSPFELPTIPDYPDAPESWRRLLALHRELARLRAEPTYFLAYRDAAKVCDGLSHQRVYDITLALDRFGAIKIKSKGKAGLNSGKAAEFRNLWAEMKH